jgi:hypothetical protein
MLRLVQTSAITLLNVRVARVHSPGIAVRPLLPERASVFLKEQD